MDISIRNVSKRYGNIQAINDITLDIPSGEIIGLLGKNGAGKTTTMECLLGLRTPDRGEILIRNEPAILVKDRIGAVLQSTALQDKITPREALQLLAGFYPTPASPDELMNQFDLIGKSNAAFNTLSGGQKQRLALAMAMINNPAVLVLDEPTAGLDPEARQSLRDLIFKSRGDRTILLSTHDIEEAHQLCDRIAIIHHGKIVATGTPDELILSSQAKSRVAFSTGPALSETVLRDLFGNSNFTQVGARWEVESNDPIAPVRLILQRIEESNYRLIDLEVRRPSLETVFLQLTKEHA